MIRLKALCEKALNEAGILDDLILNIGNERAQIEMKHFFDALDKEAIDRLKIGDLLENYNE